MAHLDGPAVSVRPLIRALSIPDRHRGLAALISLNAGPG